MHVKLKGLKDLKGLNYWHPCLINEAMLLLFFLGAR